VRLHGAQLLRDAPRVHILRRASLQGRGQEGVRARPIRNGVVRRAAVLLSREGAAAACETRRRNRRALARESQGARGARAPVQNALSLASTVAKEAAVPGDQNYRPSIVIQLQDDAECVARDACVCSRM